MRWRRMEEADEIVDEIDERRSYASKEKAKAIAAAETVEEDEVAEEDTHESDRDTDDDIYDSDYYDDDEYGAETTYDAYDRSVRSIYGETATEYAEDSFVDDDFELSQSEREEMQRMKDIYLEEFRHNAATTIQAHIRTKFARQELTQRRLSRIRSSRVQKLNSNSQHRRLQREKLQDLSSVNLKLRRKLKELNGQLDEKLENAQKQYNQKKEVARQREKKKAERQRQMQQEMGKKDEELKKLWGQMEVLSRKNKKLELEITAKSKNTRLREHEDGDRELDLQLETLLSENKSLKAIAHNQKEALTSEDRAIMTHFNKCEEEAAQVKILIRAAERENRSKVKKLHSGASKIRNLTQAVKATQRQVNQLSKAAQDELFQALEDEAEATGTVAGAKSKGNGKGKSLEVQKLRLEIESLELESTAAKALKSLREKTEQLQHTCDVAANRGRFVSEKGEAQVHAAKQDVEAHRKRTQAVQRAAQAKEDESLALEEELRAVQQQYLLAKAHADAQSKARAAARAQAKAKAQAKAQARKADVLSTEMGIQEESCLTPSKPQGVRPSRAGSSTKARSRFLRMKPNAVGVASPSKFQNINRPSRNQFGFKMDTSRSQMDDCHSTVRSGVSSTSARAEELRASQRELSRKGVNKFGYRPSPRQKAEAAMWTSLLVAQQAQHGIDSGEQGYTRQQWLLQRLAMAEQQLSTRLGRRRSEKERQRAACEEDKQGQEKVHEKQEEQDQLEQDQLEQEQEEQEEQEQEEQEQEEQEQEEQEEQDQDQREQNEQMEPIEYTAKTQEKLDKRKSSEDDRLKLADMWLEEEKSSLPLHAADGEAEKSVPPLPSPLRPPPLRPPPLP